jgi:hypothetical protein
MGFFNNIKEEIRVVRERDPAIHSNMEVFLYPSFKVMFYYRLGPQTVFEETLLSGPVDIPERSEKDRYRDTSGSADR